MTGIGDGDRLVLIVGAGPTGLSLALQLATRGIACRIIDKAHSAGETSRAMGVQARTLEFYRQLGIADEVVARGTPMDVIRIRDGVRNVARIAFRDMGDALSPYPYMLGFPQDEHERFLIEKLAQYGVHVERDTELVDFTQDADDIRATLRSLTGGDIVCRARYLCGCDGAHSTVRERAGIGFEGGTYPQLFWLADVHATGKPVGEMFARIDAQAMALMMTVRTSGTQRLVGFLPPDLSVKADLTFSDVRPMVERMLGVIIERVEWFSTYRVHHRVVDRFRDGRVFLLGDAGHVHSPAGGQGMNTGIGDAVNLGWKLSHVIAGRANVTLLDTYEPERIAFARKLVATTDTTFSVLADQGLTGTILRKWVIPRVAPLVTRLRFVRRMMFRVVSQIRIEYRDSALSDGRAGKICAGDRLPWVTTPDGDNFEPLSSMDWQVHVYGHAVDALRNACRTAGLAMYVMPWSKAAADAGMVRDAWYLVRPDGYIAVAAADQMVGRLESYIAKFSLRFEAAVTSR